MIILVRLKILNFDWFNLRILFLQVKDFVWVFIVPLYTNGRFCFCYQTCDFCC